LKIIVQKFGGTSLATPELRSRVCDIIESSWEKDCGLVVVVSAIGRAGSPYATDTLIDLVKAVNDTPDLRELDILMSCGETISGVLLSAQLNARGLPACFFSGADAGIITNNNHGSAHILYVKPEKIIDCLNKGKIAVVAGFQGISEDNEITTLGRGGSDTTASALGVALNADYIDIFTDVEGVMTADPRIVENARLLDAVTYNEICQLARDGAKIVHPRAIEIAMQKGIPLRVRSTFSDSLGTLVANHKQVNNEPVRMISERLITGITYTSNLTQIKIFLPDEKQAQETVLQIFKTLALSNISVDFISIQPGVILFTVQGENSSRALKILKDHGLDARAEANCAKVAVVGAAMTGIPGIMSKVIEALTEQNIEILQSGDSYTNIWCLVFAQNLEKAVKSLHDKFELGN